MADDRLTRIENKLDQLADAMITMARMEEKMVTLFKRMDKYDDGQSRMGERLHILEKINAKAGAFGYIADKFIWIVFGAGVTIFVKRLLE
jgi:hypothetical protein